MMADILLFIVNCFILIKISQAHVIRDGVIAPPPPVMTGPPTAPASPFDRITPKCYPETAVAYFLPAPPSSPKITILDPKFLDIASGIPSSFNEMSSNCPLAAAISRTNFPPPLSSTPMLPDLIDEVPSLIQDRFSRLAESDVKVCDMCAGLTKQLPIFNFDQELLDGFLAGLGL